MDKNEPIIRVSESNESTIEQPEQVFLTLSSLHEISKSLLSLSEKKPIKILEIIADNALKALEADLVILYEYEKQNDDVRIPPVIKGDVKSINVITEKGKAVPHKKSITFKILEKCKPFYADNAKEDWIKEGFMSRWSINKKKGFINRERIVSSAGIPLRVDNDVVGVLFVNYRKSYKFSDTRKKYIEIFANCAALAIRKARIFIKNQRYMEQLSALNEIGKEISSAATLDIDNILHLVYEQTSRLMDVTNFYIAFYNEAEKMVHFKLAMENEQDRTGEDEYASRKEGNGLTEYIIHNKKSLLVPDKVVAWLRANGIKRVGKPAKSWLGAPMIVEDKVLGVIGVQNFEKENAYDEDHRNVLATIASQAAIAISKANIFQEEKNRMKELSAFYETSREITEKALDIKSVLQAILKRAVEIANVQGGSILLCNKAKKEFKIVVTQNLDILLGHSIKFGEGMAKEVYETGKPSFHNSYYLWRGRAPLLKKEKFQNLFKALAEVPLKLEGEVIGILAISTTEENRIFTEKDIQLLERFAGAVAIAIKNARIHSYLQTLVDSTPDAIIAVDNSGIIIEFNKASENILEYRMKDVIGKHVKNFYWDGFSEAHRINEMMHSSKGGKMRNAETYVKSNTGEKIPIKFAGALLYDEDGEEIGSVGHMEDMREIKLLENRYRALYEVGKVAVEIPQNDLKKICNEFMDILTKRLINFKAGFLCLLNEENDLEFMAVGGDIEELGLEFISIKGRGEKLGEEFLKRLGSIYISSVQNDERVKWIDGGEMKKRYSSQVIPLIVRGNRIGEITVFRGDENEFSKEEKDFLERFAGLAALVINKAKDVNMAMRIAETLQRITYDIVELSGENIKGDWLHKIEKIMKSRIPDVNFCIYQCDVDNGQRAAILDCTPDDFRNRLKNEFYIGESPFKSNLDIDPNYYRVIPTCGSGQSERIEGFLVIEKIPTENGTIRPFNEIDMLILPMLASALGIALYHWRRNLLKVTKNGESKKKVHKS